MKNIYGVYGASGFGREVMPLVREELIKNSEDIANLYFIDDSSNSSTEVNGQIVLRYEEFLKLVADKKFITVAIADSSIREKLTLKCEKDNILPLNVTASNSVQLDDISIGDGYILSPFTTLTSNIKIGKAFHCNLYSYVAHDCVIGDYVTFAARVQCNGNIEIGDNVYVGSGVIIKQGKSERPIKIGSGAKISAGSVVTKSVPAGMTVFGDPAIELTKENLKRRS